ncbi:MAG: YfbK domain-containing protein [Adhaeribacter sp.]
MRKSAFLLALFSLLLVLGTSAQDRSLSGLVTDASDGSPLPGVTVVLKGSSTGTSTDARGQFTLAIPAGSQSLVFSFIGYQSQEVKITNQKTLKVKLQADKHDLEEVVVVGFGTKAKSARIGGIAAATAPASQQPSIMIRGVQPYSPRPEHNTEAYDRIEESIFLDPGKNPLSTFSIDVDAASYSNLRRFLGNGQAPPKDAVRIEEMLNYFSYDYPQPRGTDPLSITTELAACPWNPSNKLLHIGLQGKEIATEELPAANLVFLIDVSGSMGTPDRLPLVKAGFRLLTEQLRPQDRVAIVVYAGAAGLVLPSTPGNQKDRILQAIENLQAGGSTAGGAGIALAYRTAQENFQRGGNNRVILASDGDFNVGVSSDAEMERLIEEKRQAGVFLTVLGFGRGNLKDSKMEKLADKGNGHYAYIDNLQEARKVFVSEFGGTLFTIAKDVKLQLEFNPAHVQSYRLIGYENRALRNEDFANDKKDAGDLGAGHTVTALYEIVPARGRRDRSDEELRYQTRQVNPKTANSRELVTLKLRYKEPNGHSSKLLEKVVTDQAAELPASSDNFRFAAAVASFGMLLRDSEFKGQASYPSVLALAEQARGQDREGYRVEFINLVKLASLLPHSGSPATGMKAD